MNRNWYDSFMGYRITAQLIRDQPPGRFTSSFDQPTEESDSGLRITFRLHQYIDHVTILIDGSISITLLIANPDKDFVDKPGIAVCHIVCASAERNLVRGLREYWGWEFYAWIRFEGQLCFEGLP